MVLACYAAVRPAEEKLHGLGHARALKKPIRNLVTHVRRQQSS